MPGESRPLIASSILTRRSMQDQVAVVTGAGRGIGRETARALAWMGACVVIAEVDPRLGRETASQINREFHPNASLFIQTDIGDEDSVNHLARQVIRLFGRIDVVLNNAVSMPVGAVRDVPIHTWDASYRVNLRGLVLLLRVFLPAMLQQDSGVLAFIASSGGKYRGAFETLKRAQVELAHILDAELEKSGVIAFSLYPGQVQTPGLETVQRQISTLTGQPGTPLPAASPEPVLSMEAAGAAIAAAAALATRYRGKDITALEVLKDTGIPLMPPLLL